MLNVGQPGLEKNRRTEDRHRLRLMALLDGLVRENAVSRSTTDLDMGQRTLTASPENESQTRRMRALLDDTKGKLTRREIPHRTGHCWLGYVSEVAGTDGGWRLS